MLLLLSSGEGLHFGVVAVLVVLSLASVVVIVFVSLEILALLLRLVVVLLRRRHRCWMVVIVGWEGVLCRPFSFLCYLAVLYVVRINRV